MATICIVTCIILGWLFGVVYSAKDKRNKFSFKSIIINSIGFIIGWLIITIIKGTYDNILYLVFYLIGYGLGEYCYIKK